MELSLRGFFSLLLSMAAFFALACSNKNESPKPSAESPSKPEPGVSFECGAIQCQSKTEFCTVQRFTTGGKIIKSECHNLEKIDGKDNCESADANLPAELKDMGRFCYDSNGEVTLNFVTPDLLPLKDKVSDRASDGSLTIKFTDATLVGKLNGATGGYNAPVAENGRLTSDPQSMYCRVLPRNGFVQTDIPYALSPAAIKDRALAGSRWLTFTAGSAGPFALSAECIRQGDTTPFTVSDLQAIFGSLAIIGG